MGHSQAAATGSDPTAVGNALNGPPQFNLSRLVCPRLLTPNTDYLACVVPTFELGRKAGLGLPIADTELTAVNALAPAWSLTATAPVQVQLPVFYSWEFRTGAGGDFESLARLLRIASPQGLGQRTVVIGEPGFTLPSTVSKLTTVKVEGALMPLSGSTSPVLWSDPVAPVFEASLANIVNEPGLNQIIAPTADPLLAPPVYGRWYAGRAVVIPGAANWLDEMNLDPRWRSAAALGTQVVQEHQEALMASAWEQAAEIQPVNQRMRQLQLSMAVGESLHARHLMPLSEEMTLRFASPVFNRIRVASPDQVVRSLTAMMMRTSLPVPATQPAMRRIGRQRGPLTRRIAAQGYGRVPENTWVARLNLNNALPAVVPPPINQSSLPPLPTVDECGHGHLELRVCHCGGRSARAAAPGRRSATARVGLPRPLPRSRGRASFTTPAAHQCVAHSAHHDGRHRRRGARADASACGAREPRPRDCGKGRQRAAADGARRDAARHRGRDDGAIVPAADVRGAQGEITGSAVAGPGEG